jgi:hypothetical protein
MRAIFFLSLFPFLANAAPEVAVQLGPLGAAKAEVLPASVVFKYGNNKTLRISAPSGTSAYDTTKNAQLKSYPSVDGNVFVSIRFTLKEGGEDLLIVATKNNTLSEILRETISEEPGKRFIFIDLDGNGSTEILRYYDDELAILCDGERPYLGSEVYDFKTGKFNAFELPPRLVMSSSIRPTTFAAPAEPTSAIASFHAASSREGFSGVTSVSALLADKDAKTAWVEGKSGSGLGEFITAPLYGSRSIVAISLQTPSITGVVAPTAVVLAFGNGQKGDRVALDIPADTKPGSTLWYRLNAPLKASCASLILSEAPANAERVGLAGVRLVSLQEFSPKEALKAFLEEIHTAEIEKVSGAIEGLVALPADKEVDAAVQKIASDPLEKASLRAACITVLQRRGASGADVIAVYVSALRSNDVVLQNAARQSLLQKNESTLRALQEAFQKEPSVILAGIFEELLLQGADAKILAPALLSALGAGDALLQESLRRALIALGPSYASKIAERLSDSSPVIRVESARVLGGLLKKQDLPPEVIAVLVESFTKESLFEPSYAMLGALSHATKHASSVSPVFISVLQTSSEEALRARAAKALGSFSETSPAMIEGFFSDTSPMVRQALLMTLSAKNDPLSTNMVVTILSSEPWAFVRAEATTTAAGLKQEASDEALAKALYDPSKDVALAAIQSMRTFQRKSFAAPLRALLANEKAGKSRRVEAAAALGELGGAEDAKVLLKTLQDYRWPASQSEAAEDLVVSCALSLAILRYKPAFEELESLVLEGPGPILQKTGARALGMLGDNRAIPTLQLAAKQKEDPILAKIAKEALEKLAAQ